MATSRPPRSAKEHSMKRSTALVISTTALALMGTAAVGTGPALAHEPASSKGTDKHVSLTAELTELNDSGASGTATAVVKNQKIESISVHADGLTPDAPHAQHIHYGDDARNECPSLFDDTNGDGIINTVEGVPAYGPIVVSLTTTGGTTPASGLAVDRFPVSSDGSFSYFRTNIEFTDVAGTGYSGGGGTAKQIADSIREGEGVVVIHGIDYNGNGVYDFEGRGASELDPSLPAEATDPAVCGILN
jgi:hypothetical protein